MNIDRKTKLLFEKIEDSEFGDLLHVPDSYRDAGVSFEPLVLQLLWAVKKFFRIHQVRFPLGDSVHHRRVRLIRHDEQASGLQKH